MLQDAVVCGHSVKIVSGLKKMLKVEELVLR
jgi:hypothetical protein